MKKSMYVMIAVLAVVLALSVCLAACGNSGSDMEYVSKKGTLVVGVTDYAPMDYQDANGNWTGFDAEVARLVGKELGVKVEFVEIDWEQKITELKSKKIDVIWNGMTVTDELAVSMDFSYSYAQNYQAVVTKSANVSKYDSIAKMKDANVKVAVESGSAGERVANANFDKNITDLQGQTKALAEIVAGTCDVAIIDYTMAASQCGKGNYADLAIIPGLSFEKEEFAVGIRKGSDMTAKINAALVKLYKDGTIENLRKQFGEDSIALIDLGNK